MVNEPGISEEEVQEIIDDEIDNLLTKLNKSGFDVEKVDIVYELFGREEKIYVESSLLYPEGDLPEKFGVCRGYSGGGIHSPLRTTETKFAIPAYEQAEMNRVLNMFVVCFENIHTKIDEVSGAEPWDCVSL